MGRRIGTNAFNSTYCKNCGHILTRKWLTVNDEEKHLLGVREKYAIVHQINDSWDCPDGSGLNPHSDDIMPVTLTDLPKRKPKTVFMGRF